MSNDELKQLAHSLISEKIQRQEKVIMEWAVHELIQGAGEIKGAGVPFYGLCAREHCYRVVKAAVDKYEQNSEKDEKEKDKQLLLEGFDHVQAAYTVEVEGERTLVPIDLIADAELLER